MHARTHAPTHTVTTTTTQRLFSSHNKVCQSNAVHQIFPRAQINISNAASHHQGVGINCSLATKKCQETLKEKVQCWHLITCTIGLSSQSSRSYFVQQSFGPTWEAVGQSNGCLLFPLQLNADWRVDYSLLFARFLRRTWMGHQRAVDMFLSFFSCYSCITIVLV